MPRPVPYPYSEPEPEPDQVPPLSSALRAIRASALSPDTALWVLPAEVLAALCLADACAAEADEARGNNAAKAGGCANNADAPVGEAQGARACATSAVLLSAYATHLESRLRALMTDEPRARAPTASPPPSLRDWCQRWAELLASPRPVAPLADSALRASLSSLTSPRSAPQGAAPPINRKRLRYLAQAQVSAVTCERPSQAPRRTATNWQPVLNILSQYTARSG